MPSMIAWVRPSELIVIAWLVAVAVALPRDRGAWIATLVALVARVAAYGPDIHLHADKAYGLLDTPFRLASIDLRYGDGWPALMVLAGAVLRHPDTVHLVNTAIAVLTVPFVFAAVRTIADPRVATGAALILALLPLPVASADHEHQLILVGLLQATALTGMLRSTDRRDDALAAMSLGLLAHTRPLEIVEAWLGVLWLASQRRWRAVVAAGVLVSWRTVELVAFVASGGNARGAQFGNVLSTDLWTHLVGFHARIVALDPAVTPIGVTVIAGAGALVAARDARARLMVAALVLDIGLYVVQPLEPDRLRLQLPAQVWIAGLAALGLGRLAQASPRAASLVLAGAIASFLPARTPFQPPWTWQTEYRVLREAITHVPAGSIVRVSSDGALAQWASRRTGARWWPARSGAAPADFVWIGWDDPEAVDGTTPPRPSIVVETAPVHIDGTGPDPGAVSRVEFGLYRRSVAQGAPL